MTSDAVYRLLEREIILGQLKPRERLPESAICRRLKASRTLLREVFRRLEGAGLVIFQPNRGVAVRDFSPSEAEDAYYLRTALERAAIPLIIQRVRPEDIRNLRKLAGEFEAACRRGAMAAMILTNLSFHRRLTQVSGNGFLQQSLATSHLQTHQIRYVAWLSPARVQRSIREHKTILMALVRRDRAALWRVVRAHLAAGREDYRRVFPVGEGMDHAPNFHRPGAE
jgi:DNA-binding GntR family transcriptional regulator